MQTPLFIKETFAEAKRSPLWGVALIATMLMPLMLIYARAGIEVCTGTIGICFLWHSWRTKQWAWLRLPFTLACIAAWLWLLLVVTPLAYNPRSGLADALMWFRLPLMFAALRYWVLVPSFARTTMGALLALLTALIALDSFWQFFTGMSLSGHARLATGRLTGPMDGPKVGHFLGKLIVPAVAFCLDAGLRQHRPRAVAASLLLLVIVIVAIVLSGERSAFLSTMLACGIALGLLMMAVKRLRIVGILGALATVLLLVVLYMTDPWIQLRANSMVGVMQEYWQSDYGMLAAAGIDMGKQHLLHGVGLHGFGALCPAMTYMGQPFQGLHPHNAYVEWFAQAGLPGLMLFLIMLVVLFREALQRLCRAQGMERLIPAIIVGALVQHFFPLMGMQSYFTNWGAVLQWYVLSMVFAALLVSADGMLLRREV